MRRHLCVVLVVAVVVTGEVTLAGQSTRQAPPGEAPFKAFDEAVAEYLRVLKRLRPEVPPLEVTADAGDIQEASHVLALAIQRARPKARQGDFFDPAAAREITRRIRQALNGTRLRASSASAGQADVVRLVARIHDEPAFKGMPYVSMPFPSAWPLATMPPQFLEVLPPLPEELEYRFVGSHLILRDRDAAIVLDYIVRALPVPTQRVARTARR